jgi:hypothetical protein
MTRQIIALLVLVALIAGIFRAIQQSTLSQQGSLPNQTNSISTAPVPSATRTTDSTAVDSAGTNGTQRLATPTATLVGSTVVNTATVLRSTLRPTTSNQTGSRPTQFPNTGLIDELDVMRRPIVGLSILVGIIALLGYIGGRRR